ncbi:PAS domain S-box protein [Gordonibacter sp. 28C]|uniref:EAL domain-containing protein n=1 Tax=Gordonibacter sp. 28C TaxID=2078569 RepID=UPI000DF7FC97|nr:EAL domain-containing protein [Gordonibacter sp. 28C]RDB64522.1 PAS domain S-box protein [Gordonibacter sp. 28C]
MRPAWELGIAKGSSTKEEGGGGGLPASSSDHDALSGLLSRNGFNERVRSLLDDHPGEQYMLVYGDIDRFKVYNDLFGTLTGDRLLADIGTMIRDVMPAGSVAARLRADHFVCCCPRSSFDPDALLAKFDEWFSSYRDDFTFFVRVGLYAIDDPTLDVNLMCDRALLALRSAKSGYAGSKYVLYDERLRSSVLKEQELAGEMIVALENGQFVPFFQPQYRYTTGRMVGAEVLARWNHPVKGLLGPMEFIPVFERNGLIATFDFYMWDQACRCLRAWIDERGVQRVPRLSVNLSRADIYRSDLCSYLAGLVERYDVPPHLLHLEITESAYMEAPEQLIDVVTKLRAAGFTVEMDDFGSGYSSLNTLKDVPVDVLKLDMGFLDARAGVRGGLILASIVRMARWLDLPTIAEGVETNQQAAYLASVGCEYMQGYLFSKPVDRTAFEHLLDELDAEDVARPRTENLREDAAEFWDAESQLALIFNGYVGAAAIAEYDGRSLELVRLNDEFAELLDIVEDDETADLLRKDLVSVLSREDRAALCAALRRAEDGAADAACELHYRSGRGVGRWVRIRFRLLSRMGDVCTLYLMGEEATKEQALRDRLAATTSSIPGGLLFYEVAEDGPHVLDFSDAAAEFAGCTREEYLDWAESGTFSIVLDDDRPLVEAALERLRSGDQSASCTVRVRHRTEEHRWAHLSASVVYRDDDAFFVVVVAIDVTSEKNNELKLRTQNEAQQRLYDAIPCGIVRYTAEEHPRIVSMNSKSCDILGYRSLEEYLALSGGGALMPIHEDDVPRHRETIGKLLRGSPPIDFSYRYYRRDGSVGWLEGTSAIEAMAEGSPLVQSAFIDVSDKQQQRHELDLQRYTRVLCSVYEEVLEFDCEHNAYRMLYSSKHPEVDDKALPFDKAMERWMSFIPDALERSVLRKTLEGCWKSDGEKPSTCAYKVGSDDKVRWCQSTFVKVSDASLLCCNKDVTERMTAQGRERAWQDERYRLLSEMTHKISFDYDSDTDTVLLYIDRTGNGTEAQVIPRYLKTLVNTRSGVVHPDSMDDVRQMFEDARSGADKVSVEYRADYYERGYAWYRANLFVAHDEAGAWHLVGLIENIDDERELRYRAEYDATTGLSNHAATQDLITAALADPDVRGRSVCVVLDIDDFKLVNDSSGHIEGDTLLHTVGSVLQANFRESDVLGRVGGDEFVMLLKQIDLDVVLHKLEQVRNQISSTAVPGLDHAPSISIGVYATCMGDRAYRDVFVKADKALYQAKRLGKNRIRVYRD